MGVRVPTALHVVAVTIPLHACACDTCAQTPPGPVGWAPSGTPRAWDFLGAAVAGSRQGMGRVAGGCDTPARSGRSMLRTLSRCCPNRGAR